MRVERESPISAKREASRMKEYQSFSLTRWAVWRQAAISYRHLQTDYERYDLIAATL